MIKDIEYQGFKCLEISNGDARLIVATSFGPRILCYGLDGGENVFGWHPGAAVETEKGTWKPYGGHRLWVAPESKPRSYAPDNDPVEYDLADGLSVRIMQPSGGATDFGKEITVSLDQDGSGVTLDHKITNKTTDRVEIAAWALTIMRPGGEALVPNEPLLSYGDDSLLPARSMAVWPYTDFADPRWIFNTDYIGLRCDERLPNPQKFGILNKQGWVEYRLPDINFVKRFEFSDGKVYPDMNSNTEVYSAGGFIEIESLSPVKRVDPGQTIEHRERWELAGNSRFSGNEQQ